MARVEEPTCPQAITESMYHGWSKKFLGAGERWLAGDTARTAPPTRSRRSSCRSSQARKAASVVGIASAASAVVVPRAGYPWHGPASAGSGHARARPQGGVPAARR